MDIEIQEQQTAEYSQRWFDFKDGAKILIASANKPAFKRSLELNNLQSEQEMAGFKPITDESASKAQFAFHRSAAHLILGWSGLNVKGKPFEYTHQNAELLCTSSSTTHELVLFVLEKAKTLETERETAIEDEVGKSSSTTSKETSGGRLKKPKPSTKSSE
ncbi:MAG: hypothetical protein QM666_01000 [Acinetobacter sp.]